ncbi:SDR family oxidoreductase [Spirillospora sp. CA-294931]|uniref:SDR family oxidoreductase n=1 Tax=Spirillospora sp. CA-294931 TaxID=3240042 RepID=UPI003D8A496F
MREFQQVVVVTGASAGVGRATARAFASRGAALGLIARGSAGLEAAAAEIEAAGGRALVLPVDVADPDQVEAAAERAERELGPIDVWVNNAFVGVFAPFWDVGPDEFRRVTEVTYLGVVNGTRAALARMRPRDRGVIVQAGSALAYRGIPLQSAYCGAKHAIVGFTESLRTELLHDGSGVKVTMVQLPALNTPQFDWVLSRLPDRPRPVPPIYQPEVAGEAVVRAALRPGRRERWIGASTAATLAAQRLAPGLLDRYLGRTGFAAQLTGEARTNGRHNLWEPRDADRDRGARGRFGDEARSRSLLPLVRPEGGLIRRTTEVAGRRMVSWHASPSRSAPRVVCVHGAGVSSRELLPLVAELGTHVHASVVDLPGFGRSDKPSRPPDLAGLAGALAGWLEAADLAPACLLGSSFGCQLAVEVAVRRPELVGALVLVGPTIDAESRTWPRLILRWLRTSVREAPGMAPLNVADYRDAGPRRTLAAFRAAMDDRPEDKLPRVQVPTLIVRGEHDRMVPPAWAEHLTRLLPDGRLATVDGAAHMVPFRRPGAMASLVTGFLGVPDVVG